LIRDAEHFDRLQGRLWGKEEGGRGKEVVHLY
jgi:hypothetical protein